MKIDSNDLMALVGLILISSGVYFIYPPLSLIIPGVVLLGVGLWGSVK
jgi:hypothetical protein